jgi:hypothetical protein
LLSSPTSESHVAGSSEHNKNRFLTAARQKTPYVVIPHHFQGGMTRLSKHFHSQFQPIDSQPIKYNLAKHVRPQFTKITSTGNASWKKI